jgi:hypothetical protein
LLAVLAFTESAIVSGSMNADGIAERSVVLLEAYASRRAIGMHESLPSVLCDARAKH